MRAPVELALAVAATAAAALPARAWPADLHARVSREAFESVDDDPLPPPDERALASFRTALWRRFDEVPEPVLHERFRALLPTPEALTARRLKSLLMLDPERALPGFDAVDAPPAPERELVALGARAPAEDGRHRDRLWREADGTLRLAPDGTPLPADPAILETGLATGPSSEAHAHLQLRPAAERTDDLARLETEPARVSLPRDAHTFGADFAALYSDLAAIARADRSPEGRWLAATFLGNAFHHVQDACDPVNAVQLGDARVLEDAQLEAWKEELRTAGGLLGPRVGVRDAMLRILANHRQFVDDLLARAPDDPSAGGIDEALAAALAAERQAPLERAAVARLSAIASADGARAIEIARTVAAADLSRWRGRVYEPGRPESFLRAPDAFASSVEGRELQRIQAASLRRWTAFLEAWRSAPRSAPEQAAARLLALVVAREAEISARRATFVPEVRAQGLNKGVLGGLFAVIVLVGLAVRSVVRRRQILA